MRIGQGLALPLKGINGGLFGAEQSKREASRMFDGARQCEHNSHLPSRTDSSCEAPGANGDPALVRRPQTAPDFNVIEGEIAFSRKLSQVSITQ